MSEVGSLFELGFLPQHLDHSALLRAIYAAHFTLVVLVLLGTWPGLAYCFYNTFLLATLLWAIASEGVAGGRNELPVLHAVFVNVFAIPMDVLVMCSYSASIRGGNSKYGWEGFSLAMAILNLGLRLPSSAYLYRIYAERLRQTRYEAYDAAPISVRAQQQQGDGTAEESVFGAPFGHQRLPGYDYDTRPIAP